MTLDEILATAKPELLDEAFAALERTHLAHYEDAGEVFTRQRLSNLYDLVVEAIRDRSLTHLIEGSSQIAKERFEGGFDVSEVQSAFNDLEEAMWRKVVAEVPPDGLAEAIGLLSTVVGAGKDAVAREYVSMASHRHVPSLDLSALFGGTNS
ncbi:MAG: hypothetical protein U0R23_02895 [Candidatus Nanopelagicales bacterium]